MIIVLAAYEAQTSHMAVLIQPPNNPVVQGKVFYPPEAIPEKACLFTQGILLAGLAVI